jgi:hypothetical protein
MGAAPTPSATPTTTITRPGASDTGRLAVQASNHHRHTLTHRAIFAKSG